MAKDGPDVVLSMNTAIEACLNLEEIDLYTFRSKNLWAPPGARGVFGGHIIGQSLMAAIKTVPESFRLHSIHSYFVLPGDMSKPGT